MTTIEGTRQSLVRDVRSHISASRCGTTSCLDHILAVADTYAMAVLEEMYQTRQTGWDWQKKHDSLRARIAALGADAARQEQLAEREAPSVDQFLAAIGEVCRKYGYSIGHEDGHGAFIIHTFDESNLEWLGGANIELDSAEAPQPVCTCTLANVDYINDCPVHDGRTMAKYEQERAEREMGQAQTLVVNEDGE